MSDYTPTTEQVRKAYVHAYAPQQFFGPAAGADRAGLGADFDRWLEAHDAALRERIASEIDSEAQAVDRSKHLLAGGHVKNSTYRMGICDGLTGAARIARGEQP